ncbi:hypothetical protein Lalb_Chr12g0206351 [Lupinus albus]|uniref:Uncharacterized protein n=1 Tax=Lupinus albus TaxID=3870 RepID=A0A6A4PNG8_LUPAL|nr:hypothetical protein Lalb_Chr12g0206351 [Lupinus albus]
MPNSMPQSEVVFGAPWSDPVLGAPGPVLLSNALDVPSPSMARSADCSMIQWVNLANFGSSSWIIFMNSPRTFCVIFARAFVMGPPMPSSPPWSSLASTRITSEVILFIFLGYQK